MTGSRTILSRCIALLALTAALTLLSACDGSDLEELTSVYRLNVQYDSQQALIEGDDEGVNIPLSITRRRGYMNEVALSVSVGEYREAENLTTSLSRESLNLQENQSILNVKLAIGNLPIRSGQRSIIITASDGENVQEVTVNVNIAPVDAPDVYLLIGQSNMVGFGGDGHKDAGPGGPDEPDDRILQLNVSKNNEDEIFTTAAAYTQTSRIAISPYIVRAEDPLHVPLNPDTQSKAEDYIGLGLSFAKAALSGTERQIVLVPAAWSASAFCAASPLQANWNAEPSSNPNLGNTLLFDRAVARTNLALRESGGILRGILWHQGENDADSAAPQCAELYQQNLIKLVASLRSQIRSDARGLAARAADADIPFIVGTMSRGKDQNSDYSELSAEKQIVDGVHRSVAALIAYSDFTNFDDLTPANGYPCGNDSCVHFGSLAYREMGRRYYQSLLRAAGN